MLLARLVLQWAEQLKPQPGETPLIVHSPAAALALADALARLIDDMTTRQVAWERLDGLVPDNLDHYWKLTLDFLKIAGEHWPKLLDERGAIEPAARRDLLIEAERIRLAANAGAGDRRRLDRLDAGDREACSPPSRSCRTAPWCCRDSIPISTTRPGS